MPLPRSLILASTSPYRRELLARLRLAFEVVSPDVDETPIAGEAPADLALRLARAKARAVLQRSPQAVVIGSDQVADLDGAAIGKPGTHERAVQQLRTMRGRRVIFQTGVCVAAPEFEEAVLVQITVQFRNLTDAEIETYLRLEKPYDCAGSAKVETLGIALVEAVNSDDPTALIGLPLIQTCRLLRRVGLDPLDSSALRPV